MSKKFWQNYINREIEQIHQVGKANVMNAIDRIEDAVNCILNDVVFFALPALFELTIAAVVLAKLFPIKYPVTIFITAIIYLVVTINSAKKISLLHKEYYLKKNSITDFLHQAIINIELIKLSKTEKHEYDNFDKLENPRMETKYQSLKQEILYRYAESTIAGLGIIFGLVFAVIDAKRSHITTGDIVLINTYLIQFFSPLKFFGMIYLNANSYLVGLEAVSQILVKPNKAIDMQSKNDKSRLSQLRKRNDIILKNVSFAYFDKQYLFNNINVSFVSKKFNILLGSIGSGKSTLIKLILGLYKTQKGKIIKENISDEKNLFSFTPQKSQLFDRSILDNIKYSQQNATLEQVSYVCKKLGLHDYIESLPQGYNTILTRSGEHFSGGQQQILNIARALLKEAQCYVFDEATSQLDVQTERMILKAIKELLKDKTVIFITHKIVHLSLADYVTLIKCGKILINEEKSTLINKYGSLNVLINHLKRII